MQVVALPLDDPLLNLRTLVRRVVVEHEMDFEIRRHLLVDQCQKRQEVLVPTPLLARRDPLPGGDVQRGEERRRAVPNVVVGVAFAVAQVHRKRRLGAVERLDLGLLVHAEHHRVVGRVEIEPCNIQDFLEEKGVAGQLERLRQVRLDPEQGEPPLHSAVGDALGFCQAVCAPVRGAVRLVPQRALDDLCDLVVVVGAGAAGAQLVVQSLNAGS